MEFPKTLSIDATYNCSHTLHLTKTVHNSSEEECFVCWMYDSEPCPECRAASARRYREVYDAIQNPQFHGYKILFKRRMPVWDGSMLFEEWLLNGSTTRFLVERDINHHGHTPIGIYAEDNFVPFSGYTVDYMKFLLRHNREAVDAEAALRNAPKRIYRTFDDELKLDADAVLYTPLSLEWGA